jgi:hypothetical protein
VKDKLILVGVATGLVATAVGFLWFIPPAWLKERFDLVMLVGTLPVFLVVPFLFRKILKAGWFWVIFLMAVVVHVVVLSVIFQRLQNKGAWVLLLFFLPLEVGALAMGIESLRLRRRQAYRNNIGR